MVSTGHDGAGASVEVPVAETVDIDRDDRLRRIREVVTAQGSVRIQDLAEAYQVSAMTIRRDLDVLEERGWLRKVRGGAKAEASAILHGDVRKRMQTMSAAKQQVAEEAFSLVSAGDTVMFDESTSGFFLAQRLPAVERLTVVTNFMPPLQVLAGKPGIDLVGLGGPYVPDYDAFLGVGTAEAARNMSADLLFCSTSAVTRGGCYHRSQATILVKRAMMSAAERCILLLDHGKLGKRAPHLLAPLADFDLVIIDDGADEADLALLRDHGASVVVAGASG